MVRSQSISSFQFLAFAYLPTLITKVKHARARVLWITDAIGAPLAALRRMLITLSGKLLRNHSNLRRQRSYAPHQQQGNLQVDPGMAPSAKLSKTRTAAYPE